MWLAWPSWQECDWRKKPPSGLRCELRLLFLVTKILSVVTMLAEEYSCLPLWALPVQRTGEMLEIKHYIWCLLCLRESIAAGYMWAPEAECVLSFPQPLPQVNFWPFLCRDELQDERLLENMESADHDIEGEHESKPQSKGLVFKIASKRKCSLTAYPLPCLRDQGSELSLCVAVCERASKHFCFLWGIKSAKSQQEILRDLWALMFAVSLPLFCLGFSSLVSLWRHHCGGWSSAVAKKPLFFLSYVHFVFLLDWITRWLYIFLSYA